MAKRGKRMRAAHERIDRTRTYEVVEAVRLAKETAAAKFDETIELALNLGVDPRHVGTDRWLTPLGAQLAAIPIDPKLARMLLEADDRIYGALDDDQRASVEDEAIDPMAHIDPGLLDIFMELDQ